MLKSPPIKELNLSVMSFKSSIKKYIQQRNYYDDSF